MSMTGWRYDLVDRDGKRRHGRLVGDGLEKESAARAHLVHLHGSGAKDGTLVRSGPDTPKWRLSTNGPEDQDFIKRREE